VSHEASFLDLPARNGKPRSYGITMVLDKGMPVPWVEPLLGLAGPYVDVWKMGWGTAYLEPDIAGKVELLDRHGISVVADLDERREEAGRNGEAGWAPV
jgi:phosphosulfolactate synthase